MIINIFMINIITVVSGPSAHILGLNGNDCDSSDFFDFYTVICKVSYNFSQVSYGYLMINMV